MDTLIHMRPGVIALVLAAGHAAAAGETGAPRTSLNPALQTGPGMVAKPGALTLDLAFGQLDRRIDVAEQRGADGAQMIMSYERMLPGAFQPAYALPPLAGFAIIRKDADGSEYALGNGGVAAHYFGAGGLDIGSRGALAQVPALANPYFSLVPNASHAGISRELGGFRIKFGVLSTGMNHAFAMNAFDPANLSPALVAGQPRANSQLLEFSRSFSNSAVSLAFMRTREINGHVAQYPGALSFGPGAQTNSTQLTGAWLLAPKLAIAAQIAFGQTPAGSGLPGENDTRSNAFSLALVASDRFHPGDRFSLALSQPVRTYDGTTTVDVVTGVGANGSPIVERRSVSLVPTGRELRAEMNYVRPLGKSGSLGWSLAMRRNPDNIAEASTDKLIAVRYLRQF